VTGVGAGKTDQRPWGSFTVLADDGNCKVKRIVVGPGKRLSLQRHARRSEHWFIVEGTGVVTVDGVRSEVAAGDSVDIPVGSDHRMENATASDIVFVEVQHGEYFGEDDIVRLEDDFGRSDN
jgi:mannose-6-phosphate isomerase-like protein (cupin superfamily)